MNALAYIQILNNIPFLVAGIEKAVDPATSGADKFSTLISMVTPLLPAEQLAAKMPEISAYTTLAVNFYNLIGFFQKKSASAPVAIAPASTINTDAVN